MSRQASAFAQAALIAGIGVYGASIMLIAQMYHMQGNPADAVLALALGGRLAAVLAKSRPALAATFLLISLWSGWNAAQARRRIGVFCRCGPPPPAQRPPCAGVPACTLRPSACCCGRRRSASSCLTGTPIGPSPAPASPSPAVAMLVERTGDRHARWAAPVFAYAITLALAALFTMQFLDDDWMIGAARGLPLGRQVPLAAVALALLRATMGWALRTRARATLWLAYAGFAIEIVMLYARTFGSLLNTSLFFLVAAAIVGLLAWAAYRLRLRGGVARATP